VVSPPGDDRGDFQGMDIAFSREEKIGVNGFGNEISLLTNYLCI